MLKTVFHVDEMEKWNLALANINNYLNADLDEEVLIHLVAYAVAVNGYKLDSDLGERIKELSKKGVVFKACNNALKANELEAKDIFKEVQIVPSGVVELTLLQKDGFAYIRP